MIEQTYFLDMIPGESTPPVVHVSQFDVNSRTLTFNLMKGGVAFVPDAGMSVTLDGMKPDNHVFSYPMTVNGSSVSIDVLTQMTVVSGHVRCEVSVSNQSGKIGSANFILAVEESPIDSGTISESDIPIFEDLKNQAQQAAADAEQSASDAEGFATDAETAATSVSAMMATVESTSTASKTYSVGDYLVLNGQLYKVTAAVASGEALVINTNIEATTAGTELTSLNNSLTYETFLSKVTQNETLQTGRFERIGKVVTFSIQGQSKARAESDLIITLPSGYRPRGTYFFTGMIGAVTGIFSLNSNGRLTIYNASSYPTGRVYVSGSYIIYS